MQLSTLFIIGADPVESAFREAAEKEAEELGQDLIRHKNNKRAQQDEPESQLYDILQQRGLMPKSALLEFPGLVKLVKYKAE